MGFLFLTTVIVLIIYFIISMVVWLSLDNKRPMSKELQRKILDKIEGGISVDYEGGRDGVIYTYPDRLRFYWYPVFIRYDFKGIGWTTPWSPLSKKLGVMEKKRKQKNMDKKLLRYGLGE